VLDGGTGKHFLKTKVMSNLRNAVSESMACGTFFWLETERQFSETCKSSLQTHLKLKFDDNTSPDLTRLEKQNPPWSILHPLKLTCLSEDLFTSCHCKRKNAGTSMMKLETKSKRNQLNLLSQRWLQKHTSIHFTRSGTGSFRASASLMSFSTRFIWNIHHKCLILLRIDPHLLHKDSCTPTSKNCSQQKTANPCCQTGKHSNETK
jgi:hypothetical protein